MSPNQIGVLSLQRILITLELFCYGKYEIKLGFQILIILIN